MKRLWLGLMTLVVISVLNKASYSQEAPILQGYASKQVSLDETRREAFKGVRKWVFVRTNPKLDPDMMENLKARIEKVSCLPDRRISVLNAAFYSVHFFGKYQAYLYTSEGKLLKVGVMSKPIVADGSLVEGYYPVRVANYAYPSGRLTEVGYNTAPGDDYLFRADGTLSSYCSGHQCYSASGALIGIRTGTEVCP